MREGSIWIFFKFESHRYKPLGGGWLAWWILYNGLPEEMVEFFWPWHLRSLPAPKTLP